MDGIFSLLLRVFAVGLCCVIGVLVITFVYLQGVELGKQVGRGEFACNASGGKFIALDDNEHVQCESRGPIKWVYSVEAKEK